MPMRTEALLDAICETLARNCGDMHAAALDNGVSPQFLTAWAKDDKETQDRLTEAARIGYMGLESEAMRRAVKGIDKGIYYKGELVATEKQYSDSLLVKLMEARIPEYRTKSLSEAQPSQTFNGPVQVNMMPRANNFEEWLEMKRMVESNYQAARALPEPTVLEGSFVAVSDGEYHKEQAAETAAALAPRRGRPLNDPFANI